MIQRSTGAKKGMQAVICDRCKKVCTDSSSVQVVIDRGITIRRDFDLCQTCKKWLYKELGTKEEMRERETWVFNR